MKVFLSILILTATLFATPIVLTLEGDISNITDYDGSISSNGISIGDHVIYKILVDEDIIGSVTYSSTGGSPLTGAVYADLLSGSVLGEDNTSNYEINGFWMGGMGSTFRVSAGGSNFIELMSPISSLDIGTAFHGYESGNSSIGSGVIDFAELRITGSAPQAVPEPTLISLLFVGFISLPLLNRKK